MKAAGGKKKMGPKKGKRPSASSDDEAEDISVLGSSLSVGVRGVRELLRAVNEGTREELVNNECSLIYECRVCRNLFRSVANFIAHKRKYCRKNYRYFSHGFFNDQLESRSEIQVPNPVVVEPEAPPHGHDKENGWTRMDAASSSAVDPTARVKTSPLKRMRAQQVIGEADEGATTPALVCRLEAVPHSRSAVFQTVLHKGVATKSMRQELQDLNDSSTPEVLVLADGATEPSGHGGKGGQFVCGACKTPFSTPRALQRHEAVYHQPRTCYPCPLCKIFLASPWGVYRHLSKIHHKTEEQIRRLRGVVLSKAMKRELYQPVLSSTVVAASATTRTEDEKWIAQFEGELHCSVCGKPFTRRAALAVHSVKCKPVLKASKEQVSETADPLRCSKCGKEFARRAVLTTHSQSCRGPVAPPLRAHACRFCGRVFPRRRPLEVHVSRCPRAPPRSPLRHLMTPPRLMTAPSHISPSAIQVRRDYNKLSPTLFSSVEILPKRPRPAKLEAVVRKLLENSCSPTVPPSPLKHAVHSPNKSPSRSLDHTQKARIMTSPINGSRFIISPLANPTLTVALRGTASSVSDSRFLIAAAVSNKMSPSRLTVRPVRSPLGQNNPSPRPIPLIDLEPPQESFPRAAINIPQESPNSCSLNPARIQKQCVREERATVENASVEQVSDGAHKIEDPSGISFTSSTDVRCGATDAVALEISTVSPCAMDVRECETDDSEIVRVTRRGDSSVNNPESLGNDVPSTGHERTDKNVPSTCHEINIPVTFCNDEPNNENASTVSLVRLPVVGPSISTAATESSSYLDTEPEPSTSRPPSTSVFIEPTTPGASRINSPSPAVADMSDIELHGDFLSPSSLLALREETHQETDSDVISLTSRETERSEDSCSTRGGTPPADPPSCLLADDSGVSDDGCLPEVAVEGKYSPFRGFDTLVLQDHLPKIRLNALISNLNAQLESLGDKERCLARPYANGKRLLFLDKDEMTHSQL